MMPPNGSFVKGNKAYRLDYDRRGASIYRNRNHMRPEWLPKWEEVAFCTTAEEFEKHFPSESITEENEWVAAAYFWKDIEDAKV